MTHFIIISVECKEGEECTKLTEINESELGNLWPLLNYIKFNYSGYFATGNYLKKKDPSPNILYSNLTGWKELITRLPEPISGIKRISEIKVFSETPVSLYM